MNDLLTSLVTLRNDWKVAAEAHQNLYVLSNYQDRKSLAYAEMLRSVVQELEEVISNHKSKP